MVCEGLQALLFPGNSSKAASILDFRARLANRCKDFPGTSPMAALILDFRARLGNRCKVLPVYPLFRASILDFRARLGNRCKDFPVYPLLRASILDFRPRLGNRCSIVVGSRQGQDAPFTKPMLYAASDTVSTHNAVRIRHPSKGLRLFKVDLLLERFGRATASSSPAKFTSSKQI